MYVGGACGYVEVARKTAYDYYDFKLEDTTNARARVKDE
jgi:hypothetical protein